MSETLREAVERLVDRADAREDAACRLVTTTALRAALAEHRTPEGEAREAVLDAAVNDVRRDFIVEALSWAETIHDGRLGSERAEMLLASHDAALTAKARAEAWDEGWTAGCNDQQYGDENARPWTPNPYGEASA